MIVCCRRTWFRCWLDEALHALHVNVPWVCEWHDRAITAEPGRA